MLEDFPFITSIIFFPFSYMMSNGYKPSPLDLSDIKLTPGQELLVDKLAENAHNVWAKDRIKQGWTYGIQQVLHVDMLVFMYNILGPTQTMKVLI